MATPKTVTAVATPNLANAGTYTAGDNIGGKLTFTFPGLTGLQGAILLSAVLADKAAGAKNIDLVLFNSDPSSTTFTDNSALDVDDGDLLKSSGYVTFLNYSSFSDNAVGQVDAQGKALTLDEGVLYGALVLRGADQAYASGDLQVALTLSVDSA